MGSALPFLLIGALSVQIRDDLGYSVTMVGLWIGAAFGVAGLFSALLGRVAQILGPGRALRVGLTGTTAVLIAVAAWARDPWHFFVLLGLSGFFNGLNQPAANLLLSSRASVDRLGLALAVKQSGMPASALLGGAAVPAIALTAGWRWAFVAAAVLTVVAISIQPIGEADNVKLVDARVNDAKPEMPYRLLALYSLVGFLGATTAGALVNLFTSGATESGMNPGWAGVLLSIGSATGIVSRLYQGWAVDTKGILPIQRLVWLFGLGTIGLLVMATHRPLFYALAVPLSFGAGWSWPGLFNLSIIRNNASAPAAATGVSQIGVFVGAGIGPVIGGVIVDWFGYRELWIFCAAALALGASLAVFLRTRIKANRVLGLRLS